MNRVPPETARDDDDDGSGGNRARSEVSLVEIVCPLCGCPQFSMVEQQVQDYVYGVSGEFRFVRCGECQHVYLNPRPREEALMDCYPAHYAPHHRRASSSPEEAAPPIGGAGPARRPGSWVRRGLARIPLLKRFLIWLGQQHATVRWAPAAGSPGRLLEVGCAHGGYLAEAAASGWSVDGVEPNAAAAQQARQRGLDVRTGTLSEARIESESREAVVAWMVLEHVPDPAGFLREAHRILTGGGQLAVSVPNGGGFERRLFGRYWLGYDAPRHLQVFTEARLGRLLAEIGFTEIRTIHQASIRYWWGSVAAWGLERFPRAGWPRRWMTYFIDEPPAWVERCALVPSKLVSVLRCSGRITVVAVKPVADRRE